MLTSCNQKKATMQADVASLSWKDIEAKANGTTVHLMMWQGDPQINAYMADYVVPQIKKLYNIDLKIVAGQGNQIVSLLLNEKQASKTTSEIDLGWINGETFYQLRQIDGLYGPFTNQLPNAQYINFNNKFINTDFQEPINGMECPWGNVQMCLIYNKDKVANPPKNITELASYVKANPGRFTIGNDFTGLTFLKSMLVEIAGADTSLKGKFNEAAYKKYSQQLWDYINTNKKYFWKEGKTFPNAVAPMHQMFASGELYFTMSNNDGEVDNKVALGTFPTFARSYVFDAGTIQNSHYMGIIKNSGNKAGAMVVVNFLISPAAQLQKNKSTVWGDGTVLNINSLPDSFQQQFKQLGNRMYGPQRSDIEQKAIEELAPEYMIRLSDDFRKYVIEQ